MYAKQTKTAKACHTHAYNDVKNAKEKALLKENSPSTTDRKRAVNKAIKKGTDKNRKKQKEESIGIAKEPT